MLASTLGGLADSPISGRPPCEAWSDFLDTQSRSTTYCTTYVSVFASKTMGNHGLKSKPTALATRLQAKEKQGRPRHTPQHIANPAGLCDTHDADDSITERMARNHKGNREKQWAIQ